MVELLDCIFDSIAYGVSIIINSFSEMCYFLLNVPSPFVGLCVSLIVCVVVSYLSILIIKKEKKKKKKN